MDSSAIRTRHRNQETCHQEPVKTAGNNKQGDESSSGGIVQIVKLHHVDGKVVNPMIHQSPSNLTFVADISLTPYLGVYIYIYRHDVLVCM